MVIKYPVKGADGHEGSVKRSLAHSLHRFSSTTLMVFYLFSFSYFVRKNRSPPFFLLFLFLLLFVSSRDSISSSSNERERERNS